jgi:hypothetical protein
MFTGSLVLMGGRRSQTSRRYVMRVNVVCAAAPRATIRIKAA